MINVKVDEDSLASVASTFKKKFTKNVQEANREIAREWGELLIRQQRRFHRSLRWPPLSKEYLDRKRKEYRKTDVRYLVTLKRTGRMLNGYLEGIQSNVRFSDGTLGVIMPFPVGEAGIRARAHQGVTGRPQGMPARPFDVEEFEELAVKKLEEAIDKSIK